MMLLMLQFVLLPTKPGQKRHRGLIRPVSPRIPSPRRQPVSDGSGRPALAPPTRTVKRRITGARSERTTTSTV